MNMMAVLALTAAASGALPVQQKLDQIDRTFICPEDLPSDEARDAAMKLFVEQCTRLTRVRQSPTWSHIAIRCL